MSLSQCSIYIRNAREVFSMCMQVQGPLPRIASQSVLTLTSCSLLSSKSTNPKLKPMTRSAHSLKGEMDTCESSKSLPRPLVIPAYHSFINNGTPVASSSVRLISSLKGRFWSQELQCIILIRYLLPVIADLALGCVGASRRL